MWLMMAHYPHPINSDPFLSYRTRWIFLQTKRDCCASMTTRRSGNSSVIRWASVTHLNDLVLCSAVEVIFSAPCLHKLPDSQEKHWNLISLGTQMYGCKVMSCFTDHLINQPSFTILQSKQSDSVCTVPHTSPCLYPVGLPRALHTALASLVKWVKWSSRSHTSVSQLKKLGLSLATVLHVGNNRGCTLCSELWSECFTPPAASVPESFSASLSREEKTRDKIKTTTHSNCIDSHWPRRERPLTSSQGSSFGLELTRCSSVRPEVKIVGFLFIFSERGSKNISQEVWWQASWFLDTFALTETEQNANKCLRESLLSMFKCICCRC